MIPKHIAIIMDGNGRWAKKRNLPKIEGHRRGVETIKKIVKKCCSLDIKYLTLYAFSTENWLRPKKEVSALLMLLNRFLDFEMKMFHENNVRLKIIGERDKLKKPLLKKIEKNEALTKDYKQLTLNIALSYGSRQEIINAVKNISKDVLDESILINDIDEKLFSKYLYTHHSPDPELLIRTSGEMRLSNFLLWQLSYAEIYVIDKLWPDFSEKDLDLAIDEFNKRERRFGR